MSLKDVRRFEHRQTLPQLSSQSKPNLKDVLNSLNSELSQPFNLTKGTTRQVSVGANRIVNPQTSKVRTNQPISNNHINFTGGTITFPSTSGSVIVTSVGEDPIITIGVGKYKKVIISIDKDGNIVLDQGSDHDTVLDAFNEAIQTSETNIGHVIVRNVSGTIQDFLLSDITQYSGGGGVGGTSETSNVVEYITNGQAETGTSGWTRYKNTTVGVGPDDFGGTPSLVNVAWSRITFGQLRGDGSFELSKDANNRQGEGIFFEWDNLALIDKSRMLKISAEVSTSSGYADGDIRFYIVSSNDGFSSDFNIIETVPIELLAGTGKYISYFQTDASNTNYRLVIHIASTNSSAYTVKFDSISVSPTIESYGQPMTEWESYVPTTQGWGSISGVSVYKQRVGSNLHVYGYFTGGTVVASECQIGLGGLTIASNMTDDTWIAGNFTRHASTNTGFTILATAGDTYVNVGIHGDSGSAANAGDPIDGNSWFSNSEGFSFSFMVPIAGWGISAQLGSIDSVRETSGRVYTVASTEIADSTNTFIGFVNEDWDTHNKFTNINTASSTTYTSTTYYKADSSGKFDVNTQLSVLDNDLDADERIVIGLAVNGSSVRYKEFQSSATATTVKRTGSINDTLKLVAGDLVSVFIYHTAGANITLDPDDNISWFTIKKEMGNQQAMVGETVVARYDTDSGQSIPTSITIVNFDSTTYGYDSHKSVTTGVTWRFKPESSGVYAIKSYVQFASDPGWDVDELAWLSVYKNNNYAARLDLFEHNSGAAASVIVSLGGATELYLGVDDFIDIRVFQNSGAAKSLDSSEEANWVSIHKVR